MRKLFTNSKRKAALQRWSRQAFFTLIEHGFVRLLDATITFLLIRLLLPTQFGLYSVYQSWVALLFLFLPAIELALYRHYGHLKSEGQLGATLGAFRLFNLMKLSFSVVLIFILGCFEQESSNYSTRVSLLGIAMLLPFSQAFLSYLREPLRFEIKQATVAILSFLQRVLWILAFGVAYYLLKPTPENLILLALASFLITIFFWSHSSKKTICPISGKICFFDPSYFKILRHYILGPVLWMHVNGVITQILQTFDVFALNYFGNSLDEIGRYNLALKAANFFQIFPIALASSFGVYLARKSSSSIEGKLKEKKITLFLSGIFALLCAALYFFGSHVSLPIIQFLAKGKGSVLDLQTASTYFQWQVAGVLVLCASYPISTYLSSKGNLKRVFLFVNVPWFFLSVGIYFYAAHSGALAAAKANVAVNGLAVALLFLQFLISDSKDS